MNNSMSILKDALIKPPQSYWMASTEETSYPALEADINVDTAIIGGGMVGITTGFLLKKEGMKVAVIEADRIVQGTTAHTTAKITSQHKLIYDKIKSNYGMELARQYADANETAIRFMSELIQQKNIECDFNNQPAFVYTQSDEYVEKIQKEADTASKLGIDAVYTDDIPLPFKVKAALKFSGQAQFHPRKYLLALAKDIPGDGSHIFEQSRVVDLQEGNPAVVITDKGKKVTAKYVIIASHFPCYDGLGMYFARIYPYRSYAVGFLAKKQFPGGMYISAEHPTRSLRFQPYEGSEMIIAAGEHHKTGHGTNLRSHYENLIQFADSSYGVEEVLYRWSKQDYQTMDGIPYVGHLTSGKPNLFVATGFDKWGMTNSTVSAIMFRDLIVKGENPWTEVYNPSRANITASAATFIKENADVAVQLVSGKLQSLPEGIDIKNGEAKVVQGSGQRLGAYRDEKGVLHVVDTTCTHMGCELQWNDAERSWDCPCHGSRFTYEGEVVEGPAFNPLSHRAEQPNTIDPNIF
ncbi:MAG: FAD-dependent oxidoreductase [Bacillota bacterium]